MKEGFVQAAARIKMLELFQMGPRWDPKILGLCLLDGRCVWVPQLHTDRRIAEWLLDLKGPQRSFSYNCRVMPAEGRGSSARRELLGCIQAWGSGGGRPTAGSFLWGMSDGGK